ncbi:hypothetical protein S40285_03217 [Stachybotrys chlorohalonatus IBT 40285]|uniref:Ribosomal protein n=1 Tax=Stachybotrys chlorohalonatus (strain IBT 40285) TaxID=1283841 RepID=A0A084QNH6_STAC4|nr:hypothetical protein S40285_03217 [Stachybotrys chlorohalonata IBT 40285]
MASLLRRLSPFAGLLGSRTFATPFFSRAWSSPAALTSMSNTLTASTSQSIGGVLQQTRGMKVHSSIKKRCEHCKVVRRKAGKRHNGYRYIICSANPRHKQRQG